MKKPEQHEEPEIEESEEEFEEEEQGESSPKGGFISKIKSWFASDEEEGPEASSEEEHAEEGDHPSIDDEIKEVLRVQNKWLAKLPPEVIREFKESEDYKFYKETLAKYHLIKK